MSIIEQIDMTKIPRHIAIIMDGNGRWAKQQGEDRLFGHNIGVESVREALSAAQDLGVQHLTLYAFSTENWNRPKAEVDGLMDLLVHTIAEEIPELHENNVRVTTIGDTEGLPESCREELKSAIEKTSKNTGVNLILALNYSARWEIVNAAKNCAQKVLDGKANVEDIDCDFFSNELSTKSIPDPELLIRTSGEQRISNYLLWQIAYTELYFTNVLWPDFKKKDLLEAVLDYQSRERRFGMVSEQLSK